MTRPRGAPNARTNTVNAPQRKIDLTLAGTQKTSMIGR